MLIERKNAEQKKGKKRQRSAEHAIVMHVKPGAVNSFSRTDGAEKRSPFTFAAGIIITSVSKQTNPFSLRHDDDETMKSGWMTQDLFLPGSVR